MPMLLRRLGFHNGWIENDYYLLTRFSYILDRTSVEAVIKGHSTAVKNHTRSLKDISLCVISSSRILGTARNETEKLDSPLHHFPDLRLVSFEDHLTLVSLLHSTVPSRSKSIPIPISPLLSIAFCVHKALEQSKAERNEI